MEEPAVSCTRSRIIERNSDRFANSTSSSLSIAQTQTAGSSVESDPVSTCQLLTGVGNSGSWRSAASIAFAVMSMSVTLVRPSSVASGISVTLRHLVQEYGADGRRYQLEARPSANLPAPRCYSRWRSTWTSRPKDPTISSLTRSCVRLLHPCTISAPAATPGSRTHPPPTFPRS